MNETKVIGYIVPSPFEGSVLTALVRDSDGTEFVCYSDKSLSDYLAANQDVGARLVTDDELDALRSEHLESLVTKPKSVEEERFYWLLEVLPPQRWGTRSGVEMFHMSERLDGNIVTWACKYRDCYFEFADRDNLPAVEIASKVEAAYTLLKIAGGSSNEPM